MKFDLDFILAFTPAIFLGLIVHEMAHAYAAYKLGDPTAKNAGRITLNPLVHFDVLGFFLILLTGFGWAKPVLVNTENLKNKRRDEILISLAGPFSNLVLGSFFLLFSRYIYSINDMSQTEEGMAEVNLFISWAVINFSLFIFNLIPIPPLDGSNVYMAFLRHSNPPLFQRLQQGGIWVILIAALIQMTTTAQILPLPKLIKGLTDFCISMLGF